MKHLRETFTDQEYEELLKAKKATGKNWHDFIIYAAGGRTIKELIKEVQSVSQQTTETQKK